jgi:hypothetical protein
VSGARVEVHLAAVDRVVVAVVEGVDAAAILEVDETHAALTLALHRVGGVTHGATFAAVLKVRVQVDLAAIGGLPVAVAETERAEQRAPTVHAIHGRRVVIRRSCTIAAEHADSTRLAGLAGTATIHVDLATIAHPVCAGGRSTSTRRAHGTRTVWASRALLPRLAWGTRGSATVQVRLFAVALTVHAARRLTLAGSTTAVLTIGVGATIATQPTGLAVDPTTVDVRFVGVDATVLAVSHVRPVAALAGALLPELEVRCETGRR